jgi:ATP-dependent Lon protease
MQTFLPRIIMDKSMLQKLIDKAEANKTQTPKFFDEESYDEMLEQEALSAKNHKVIYDKSLVNRVYDNETSGKRKMILRALLKEPNHKPLAAPEPEVIHKLDDLAKRFGNFSDVINICKNACLLGSLVTPNLFSMPPLLLSGPPGVGKTRFISELASVLGTDFYSLDYSTVSSGFVVAGGASSWSDSKPGFISNSIRSSRFANPIIMLDELDKASVDTRHDPMGPMYSLLEKHTAKRFIDEYLEIPFDVSSIIWIASANYPERIPEPIRSRMLEIKISLPTNEQSIAIIRSIYTELLLEPWGEHFAVELDLKVINKLVTVSPRIARIQLENAMANAVQRSKAKVKPIVILPKDVSPSLTKPKARGIGFLAEI